MVAESPIRGLVVFVLILTILSLSSIFSHFIFPYRVPAFADECEGCVPVKLVENQQPTGVFFVPRGGTVGQALKALGIQSDCRDNRALRSGMMLIIDRSTGTVGIESSEMSNAEKIAVGLPLDVNTATEEDLMLVRGIGPVTARRIVELRQRLGGIRDMVQLMQIKGIKEKRLNRIRKFLSVQQEKTPAKLSEDPRRIETTQGCSFY